MNKVLIVNHDEDMMELLKRWLERKAIHVKCTDRANEAIPILKEFNPDIVIVDVLQFEVAKKIKEDIEISSTPVILMTGHTFNKESDYFKVADEIIKKPFGVNELDSKLNKFFSKTG